MKKQIGMVGVILAAVAVQAAPFVGKAVGEVVEKAVAREVAERAAASTVKEGSARTMSSALAGVTAKQLMGAGVAVAVPLGTYVVADGRREVDKARAETKQKIGEAVEREIHNHPELAVSALKAVNDGTRSPMDRMERWVDFALPWAYGAVAIMCLLFLAGFLSRAAAYFRRSASAVAAVRASRAAVEPAVVDVV